MGRTAALLFDDLHAAGEATLRMTAAAVALARFTAADAPTGGEVARRPAGVFRLFGA